MESNKNNQIYRGRYDQSLRITVYRKKNRVSKKTGKAIFQYEVRYYSDTVEKSSTSFADPKKARQYVSELLRLLDKKNPTLPSSSIEPDIKLVLAKILKIASKNGETLEETLSSCRLALKNLKGKSITTAVDFYNEAHGHNIEDREIREVWPLVEKELQRLDRTPKTIGKIKTSVMSLAESTGKTLFQIKKEDAQRHVESMLHHKTNLPVSHVHKKHAKGNIRRFYNICIELKLYPETFENPGKFSIEEGISERTIEILEVDEVDQILETTARYNPFLFATAAIGLFTGIRGDEIARLRWEFFNFKEKKVLLPASITKTGKSREVPISENLSKLLEPFEGCSGLVAPYINSLDTIRVLLKSKQVPIVIPNNALRHSFASYSIHNGKSADVVIAWLGHTEGMLRKHYLNSLVTNPEKYFQLGLSKTYELNGEINMTESRYLTLYENKLTKVIESELRKRREFNKTPKSTINSKVADEMKKLKYPDWLEFRPPKS